MRMPRFRIRTLMIAVAVVAIIAFVIRANTEFNSLLRAHPAGSPLSLENRERRRLANTQPDPDPPLRRAIARALRME